MKNQPFEDVSPIKNGDFPACHVSFRMGTSWTWHLFETSVPQIFGISFVAKILSGFHLGNIIGIDKYGPMDMIYLDCKINAIWILYQTFPSEY